MITEARLQMITMEQLSSYLNYRFSYMEDKKKSKQYYDIFQGFQFLSKCHYDLEQSLHFLVRNRLSNVAYNRNRLNLLPVLVLKTYNDVSQHRRNICPSLIEYKKNVTENVMEDVLQPDGSNKTKMVEKIVEKTVGVYCDLGESLVITVLRLLKANWDKVFINDLDQNLVISLRTGLDAAGDQKQYHQRSQRNIDTSHLLSIMYVVNVIFVQYPYQGKYLIMFHLQAGFSNIKFFILPKF